MAAFTSKFTTAAWVTTALVLVSGCRDYQGGTLPDKCPGSHCATSAQCTVADTFCDPNSKNEATRTDPEHAFCCVSAERACGEGVDAGLPAGTQTNPCCPGQTCSDVASLCADSPAGCTANEDCNQTIGQYCDMALTDFPKGTAGCTFHKCDTSEQCAAFGTNLSCFNSYCVAAPPCGGKCAAGSVCTPVTNTCYVLGENPSPSCQVTCNTGSLLVFEDGKNVFAYCDHTKLDKCTCLSFPNITTNDAARFSSATLAGPNILVSAYDGDHGDLVLRTFAKDTRLELATSPEWIDGVPATGVIVGNPSGPRAGIAEPGPDVGRYTSIAYDPSNDTTHVSYYATQDGTTVLGNLKYARRAGTGPWTVVTVDGQSGTTDTGDVGLYSNITIAPDHAPVIAYFQKAGVGANFGQTALRVARGKIAAPSASTDWTISTVETGTRPVPPCGGLTCPNNQVCAAVSGSPNGACVPKAASGSACAPACGSGDTCIVNNSVNSCVTPLAGPTVVGLPVGNGLMPSIAYLDNLPVVAWYDHNADVLKAVIATTDTAGAGATFEPAKIKTLDDGSTPGNTAAPHDVGRFPSLAIGASTVTQRIAISYMDSTAKQLRLVTAKADWSNATALDKRVIDNGVSTGTDASLFVGANTSLRFVGDSLALVYQDSTGTAVRVARQTSPTSAFQLTSVTTPDTGAGGFYSNLVVDGSSLYGTHMTIRAHDQQRVDNTLHVIAIP